MDHNNRHTLYLPKLLITLPFLRVLLLAEYILTNYDGHFVRISNNCHAVQNFHAIQQCHP